MIRFEVEKYGSITYFNTYARFNGVWMLIQSDIKEDDNDDRS